MLSIKNWDVDKLQSEIKKSLAMISDLKKALEYIPESSALGRLSVTMSLKHEEKRLSNLNYWLERKSN